MYRKVKPVLVERALNSRLTKKFKVEEILRIKDSCVRSDVRHDKTNKQTNKTN